MKRNNQFYYVRHIPSDLTHHYSVQRICFSLKTKSDSTAVRFSKSITQRLDDYWFGMRLKNMNVPAEDKIKRRYVKKDTFAWTNAVAAKKAHCSKGDVKTIMKKLENLGTIKCIQKGKSGSFTRRANVYRREV